MKKPIKHGPVVMGVIDDGIAFAQQRFRTVAGGTVVSRVEYWWLQDGVYQGPPLPFGRELDNAGINALVTTCTHGGVIDEDEHGCYAALLVGVKGGDGNNILMSSVVTSTVLRSKPIFLAIYKEYIGPETTQASVQTAKDTLAEFDRYNR